MNCANHPDRERIAFCQNCGNPLCQECMRSVGSAVYCEPCLAIKINAAGVTAPPPGSYTYVDPVTGFNVSGTAAGGTYTYRDPISGAYAAGTIPPAPLTGAPNPWLAAFLGFIPGVGAMYNEQYAKGIVHLIVFAVLVSIADSHDIFGLFVAGWEFYMAIEAHHTARARRDGLPLPNPFGLNDLGEKLGFGKAWAAASVPPAAVPPDPYGNVSTVPPSAGNVPAGVPPYVPPYGAGAIPPNWPPNWSATPQAAWEPYAPPIPPVPPVPLDAQVPYPGNRFPAGALWLIGFGAFFLIANAGFLHGFSNRLFLPFLLIGLGVWIFVRKMTAYGSGLGDDGSGEYRLRVIRALRSSVWVALVGVLFFLDSFNILSWGHSWPLFIIMAGIMTVAGRAAYIGTTPAAAYNPGYGYPVPPVPVYPSPASVSPEVTAIVPIDADQQIEPNDQNANGQDSQRQEER